MTKYRKLPVEIDATQWFRHGDHPKVGRYQTWRPSTPCNRCGDRLGDHGWCSTLEGGHIVCRNDWIVTGVNGEQCPCKPDIFAKTYEAVA